MTDKSVVVPYINMTVGVLEPIPGEARLIPLPEGIPINPGTGSLARTFIDLYKGVAYNQNALSFEKDDNFTNQLYCHIM